MLLGGHGGFAHGKHVARAKLTQAVAPVILGLGIFVVSSARGQTPAPATGPGVAPAVTPSPAASASSQPSTRPTTRSADVGIVAAALRGRPVEAIRIEGNIQVPTSMILNQVRTREGEPLDPTTVEDDYKRIYGLRRFGNVEARVEPTATGVIVNFTVSEQRQIKAIFLRGNRHVDTLDIMEVLDLTTGEAIDPFRIGLARQAIERLYNQKNYPYATVTVDQEALSTAGELVFQIVEGQKVRVRRVTFEGNNSFSNFRLRGEVKTSYYIWIFRAGELDYDQLEDDVAALRRFYESRGFFDVRVGRQIALNADKTEAQVTFTIAEGPRYTISTVRFEGMKAIDEKALRTDLKMLEGMPYDADVVQRDIRQMVRAYSPHGFVYQNPTATPNPDYLYIEPRTVFGSEPGKVELVYQVREGKPFNMGRVIVKGNYKTADKVILREMNLSPGQLYDSSAVAESVDRLRGLGYFNNVTVTPIGEEPDVRDVLVEVAEGRTASFQIGAGISSNGGLGGEISYEQRNFDIGNPPEDWGDLLSERSFTGAGQTFRVSVAPSSQGTSAGIRFVDPYLFDQPYIFSNDLYYRERERSDWNETRLGDRVSIGRRLSPTWIVSLNARGEDVEISNIDNPAVRAPEILDAKGHTTVTGLGPSLRYDTTNRGPVLFEGIVAQVGYERVGLLGGEPEFGKYSASVDTYHTLGEDLFDRKTVLALHGDVGYIDDNKSPVFERFYAGGMGSIRGFRYRGVSPRSGLAEDAIGGVFQLLTSAQVSYPIYADTFRGVFFVDAGTAESDVEITTYRAAVGFGFRIALPMAPQAPLAIDFGFPMIKNDQDERQVISFSFGITY